MTKLSPHFMKLGLFVQSGYEDRAHYGFSSEKRGENPRSTSEVKSSVV